MFDWRFAVFHVFEQRFNALPCFVGDPERPLMTLETVDGVVFASLAMCDSFGR
ncbi:hypothetical protein [Bifidobacterium pseudocatenulatum]|uniref:hypothetical protein n=1 Tax=Bifidobacterium pseudocatenulatum TaxID=28026 RepID=UPI000A75340C|nr:hypothetical protein [Bifidobacterium pseudocatenulatum]